MEFVQPIRDKTKIEQMKQYLKSHSLRDYTLFTLGINSGLRISDLLKMKVSDVVSEDGKIKDRISIREKKTGKAKTFPFSQNVVEALKEYLITIPSNQIMLFASRKIEGSEGKGSISRQRAYTILNEAAKACDIKGQIATHSLRKTFGFMAYEAGVDITRIQSILNHSSPKETLRYIGITQDELDDVYLELNL